MPLVASSRYGNDTMQFNNSFAYVWAADRWLSAPDDLKSHDFQYWAPLSWNDTMTPPLPLELTWTDGFWLDININP